MMELLAILFGIILALGICLLLSILKGTFFNHPEDN